ncbi:MAG: type I methionyl aminopeptidase [Pseudomonadota bacterium]|nr:type I methionyl aminopeptidase [Pseudomonadota bacterium]
MITLKTDAEIAKIRICGRLVADTLQMIERHVRPGISTLELNDICHDYTLANAAIPAPLNYKGFPKSICTSINDVICHGIPTDKETLQDGDIINIDITSILDGFHADSSKTFIVGKRATAEAEAITNCARECLYRGIETVRAGSYVGDIGAAIEKHAHKHSFSVVRDFVGHGIGRIFHEEPMIPHYGRRGKGVRLVEGMVFTIEPMINAGSWKSQILDDGWTAVTIDGRLSAQFEHTIAIAADGHVEILTDAG